MDWKSLLGSKRFWLAAAGVVAILLKDRLPMVTEEQLQQIALIIGSWIVGDSLRSTSSSRRQ